MNVLVKNGNNSASLDLSLPPMENLARAFFDRFADFGLMHGGAFDSKLEVEVTADEAVVKYPCPGCRATDFEVEIVGDFLTVRVEREEKDEADDEDKHYIFRERSFASCEESVKLPVQVNGAAAKAGYVDGVLTLHIPRREAEKPDHHVVKVN